MADMTELGNATVMNLDGASLPVKTLWSEQDAVLVFLRHFG